MGVVVELSERQFKVFERIAKALEDMNELKRRELCKPSYVPPPPEYPTKPLTAPSDDPLAWWYNQPTADSSTK